jgi:hypothetical protein
MLVAMSQGMVVVGHNSTSHAIVRWSGITRRQQTARLTTPAQSRAAPDLQMTSATSTRRNRVGTPSASG